MPYGEAQAEFSISRWRGGPNGMSIASDSLVHGPDPICLGGRNGLRYWVYQPYAFFHQPEVDERLSGYPVAVFLPPNRPPAFTPVVFGLQGMAAPLLWNDFIVPRLLDMGIACVLFDQPFGGERALARTFSGELQAELLPLVSYGIHFGSWVMPRIMEGVRLNFEFIRRLLEQRHGLCDRRIALFGVSLGTLTSAYAFCRYGFGQRLLGAIGHCDLPKFANSYGNLLTGLNGVAKRVSSHAMKTRVLKRAATLAPRVFTALAILETLHDLRGLDAHGIAANPMTYAARVGPHRRVRFLVGGEDPQVLVPDAEACADAFEDGACYAVPGLEHGSTRTGPSFCEHVIYYLTTQLEDWA